MDASQLASEILFAAVESANEQLAPEAAIRKSPESVILGPGSPLDSLGFVNFIAAVEQGCQERCGVLISVTESGLAESGSTQTIGQVTQFLAALLAKHGVR